MAACAIRTPAPLPPGQRATLRFSDEETGREWRFGGEVVWAGDRGMGLRLVGIPLLLLVGRSGESPDDEPVKAAA